MGWLASFQIYFKKRILLIFCLGISSGFPLVLTGATFGYWMSKSNVDIKTIGFFALVGTAYSFKFLWAPFIDKIHLPLFCTLLGRRKGWMLFTQIILFFAIIGLGFCNPVENLAQTALMAVILAFASASQDIVIDAYRVEILKPDELGAGAAAVTLGYRIGMLLAGALPLYMYGWGMAWPQIFSCMALLVLTGMAVALFGPRPQVEQKLKTPKKLKAWAEDAFISPLRDFMKNRGWLVFLLFIVFFKLGDAMMSGVIMGAFYGELGFEPQTLANITKWLGFATTIAGAFIGGALVKKLGIIKTLWIGAFLQAGTNLTFAMLYEAGNNVPMLAAAIGFDNLSGGIGTTAFVAFISRLCNLEYTATQYALLSSLSSVGRTTISATGGAIIAAIGWVNFFIFTTLAAAPGIILLFFITRHFAKPVDKVAPSA